MYSSCFLAPGDVQASHLFLSKEDSLMTCGGVTFFFHLKTSFCFFPSLFSMSLLPREPWKKAKILNYDICSLDWFHTHRFTLTHKHISNLSKTLLAGLKMIWYFPIICMHVTSCMIVILTMLLSSIINMPVAWVPILFYFFACGFPDRLVWPPSGWGLCSIGALQAWRPLMPLFLAHWLYVFTESLHFMVIQDPGK